MNVNELLAVFVAGNCIKNLLLALRAKAFDVAHLPCFAGRTQIFHTGNAQLFLKPFYFLDRQTGNVLKLNDAGRKLSAQFIQHRRFAG